MGLNKGIENQYGINFDYHRINDVHIIVTESGIQVRMTVSSYVNEHARRNGKAAYKTVNIIDGADFALTPFYLLLKAKFADFADAADVFEEVQQEERRRMVYTTQTLQGRLISQTEEPEPQQETTQPAEIEPEETQEAQAEEPTVIHITAAPGAQEEEQPISLEEASLVNAESDKLSGAESEQTETEENNEQEQPE